jgi:hypothetical protein
MKRLVCRSWGVRSGNIWLDTEGNWWRVRGEGRAMKWDCPSPHPAVLMGGAPWRRDFDGFTALCLTTHEIGTAGIAECIVLHRADSERSRIELALHILDCNCGWSHEYQCAEKAK